MRLFYFLSTLALSLLGGASVALADNFEVKTGVPGPVNINEYGILGYIQNAYLLALGVAAALAIGSIIYGAVQYTASRGNPSKLSDAWDRIIQALVGILLLVGAGTLLSIVNPGLLSLELPKIEQLDTPFQADPYTSTSSTSQPPIPGTNPPANETPGPGEAAHCKPAGYTSQFQCRGRWVNNAQTCPAATPLLCIYPTASTQPPRCQGTASQPSCPGGGAWRGLMNGNTCVCEIGSTVVDPPPAPDCMRSNPNNQCLNTAQACTTFGGSIITGMSCGDTQPICCRLP